MEKEILLKINKLSKEYDSVKAVDGISFSIGAGEIIGLLGPNGAGKTTTINMILGILNPSEGNIEIFGKDLKSNRSEISKKLSFAAVYAHVPPNLTVRQNLYVFGLLYGVKNLKKKIETLLKEFDLEKFADIKAGVLSSGELSRLNLAKAIINEPCLLLLDEPTASLDPHVAQIIRENIMAYIERTHAAVLWTSHNMREIESVCGKVFFMSHGKILLSGDPKNLPAEHGKKDLEELFISIAKEPLTFEEKILPVK
jgi:ABC-2 type transport system ATP-binding protein